MPFTTHKTIKASCLCPTANRLAFLPRTLQCFEQQTYSNKELIILDDGEIPAEGVIKRFQDTSRNPERIRYFYEGIVGNPDGRKIIGEKRNRCAELATGDVFVLWDADDWHGAGRVENQMTSLSLSERDICVLDDVLAETSTGFYEMTTPGRLIPATAAIRRSVWARRPWPPMSIGADLAMLLAAMSMVGSSKWTSINGRMLYRIIHHESAKVAFDLSSWRSLPKTR